MDWIKRHPLMAGGVALLLIVLFFVFRSKSGGSGTQVIQTGPSDAVTAASLQAQVQMAAIQAGYAASSSSLSAAIAGKQIDAQTALQLTSAQKDVALQSILTGGDVQNQQTQAALLATQYSTQAVVQGEQIQAGQNVSIAGIQSDTIKAQSQDQLAAQGIISKASVDMATLQAGVDTTNSNNQLQATEDTNASQVKVAGIAGDTATTLGTLQANSQDLITRTAGNIYTDQIDTQGRNIDEYIAAQLANKQQQNDIIYGLISSGQINKGGEGGSNQVSVLDSYLGNPTGGTAAAQAAGTEAVASSPGSVISSISGLFNGAAKIFSSIF